LSTPKTLALQIYHHVNTKTAIFSATDKQNETSLLDCYDTELARKFLVKASDHFETAIHFTQKVKSLSLAEKP
jgi:hypothetical protein